VPRSLEERLKNEEYLALRRGDAEKMAREFASALALQFRRIAVAGTGDEYAYAALGYTLHKPTGANDS